MDGVDKTNARVLIVDDSLTNRVLLKSMLRKEGYLVEEAENGRACLEFCQETIPDVILLDIMMPEISGIEVCQELRKSHSKDSLPIMMVTTKSEGKDVREGIEAGANDYLTKPVDRISFLARVESLLHWSASHRRLAEQQAVIERNFEIQSAMGDVLPEALLVHDEDGDILYSNFQFSRLAATEKLKTIFDAKEQILEGKLQDEMARALDEIRDSPRQVIDKEVRVDHASTRNIQIISKPIVLAREEDSPQLLRLWLWRDLTHTRELEERISQQVKLQAVSIYSAGVAHNFNNLMGGILGATEILKRLVKDNERAERCLKIIERAIHTGKSLTSKMSTIVRQDVGEGNKPLEPLAETLFTVVEVQKQCTLKDITFELDIDPYLPSVNVATVNIIDVFVNLIVNSIDSIEEHGKITIRSTPANDARFVLVEVLDDGCGIAPNNLGRIFEPFYSTKNLDVKNGVSMVGNGLGLWNVYNLLKGCGGDIEFKSVKGQGTVVKVYLPIREEVRV